MRVAVVDDIQLRQRLQRLDQQNYKAYRDIKGHYEFPAFTLRIDRVQGDPFALPSQCRVHIPQIKAGFPAELWHTPSRAIALRDYLTRQFVWVAQAIRQQRGIGNSGLIGMPQPGQTILERTTVLIHADALEARFVVGLPAFGRRVAGSQAAALLCDDLPQIVAQSLLYSSLSASAIQRHIETAEDADFIRQQLSQRGLVAFVAAGAILPRRSGVDDQPLTGAVPFQVPDSLQVSFDCPNRGTISGMGIPQGVTVIVGGGYHGKSTLLRAIERGIYNHIPGDGRNHIPGDGREFVVTDLGAVKIRAEDGRSVVGVDISPFINQLPLGGSTQSFSTTNASGSTSQAASIMEALEVGATALLVDEDTSDTNFMIRDRRMQALIHKSKEPITPLIDKIRQLYTDHGVSTILVMGGSGDYFDVADTVIALEDYIPRDVTEQARAITQQYPTARLAEGGCYFGALSPRYLRVVADRHPDAWRKHTVRDLHTIVLRREEIDLSAIEQLVEPAQLRAIAAAMLFLRQRGLIEKAPLNQAIQQVMATIEQQGLDAITSLPEGDFAQFRRFELVAAINRWRSLAIRQNPS